MQVRFSMGGDNFDACAILEQVYQMPERFWLWELEPLIKDDFGPGFTLLFETRENLPHLPLSLIKFLLANKKRLQAFNHCTKEMIFQFEKVDKLALQKLKHMTICSLDHRIIKLLAEIEVDIWCMVDGF